MNSARVLFFVMALAGFVPVACAGGATAGGSTAPAGETGHPHHPLIHFILEHATELKLTADQTAELTKLEATAPAHEHHAQGQGQGQGQGAAHHQGQTNLNGGQNQHHELPPRIKAILTPDQQTELLSLLAQRVHNHHGNHHGTSGTTQNNGTANK